MSGYVIDDLALAAGLAGTGTEHDRRELSRLIADAVRGGPGLHVPALCAWEAEHVRPGIVDHVVGLVAAAPPGAIGIAGLARTPALDGLLGLRQRVGWPAASAAAHALQTGARIITVDPGRYPATGADTIAL